MWKFFVVPAVFAIAAYATLSGAGALDVVKFILVLLLALCLLAIYAFVAKLNKNNDVGNSF